MSAYSRGSKKLFNPEIQQRAADWDGRRELNPYQKNIEAVQEICHQALTYARKYEHGSEYSLRGRIETYSELTGSLQSLAHRIHQSKSIWGRFLGFFGLNLTGEEKKIFATMQLIQEMVEPYQRLHDRITFGDFWYSGFTSKIGLQGRAIYNKLCNIARNSTDMKVTQCCFRLFRKADAHTLAALEKNRISGCNFAWTIKSVRKDLKEFRKTIPPKERPLIDKVISQLKQAAKSSTEMEFISLMESTHHFSEWFERPENHEVYARERRGNVAYEWEERIKSLKPGEDMIIPGGFQYQKSGHAVIYKIVCYSNFFNEKRYRFEILNTGDGANFNNGLMSHLKAIFWDGQFHAVDYENITLQALTDPHFLRSMVRFSSSNEVDSMDSVLQFVDRYLVRNGANRVDGDRHYLQTWGTCTYDAILLWLMKELPAPTFTRFQEFSDQRAREQLQEILPKATQTYDTDFAARLQWAAVGA